MLLSLLLFACEIIPPIYSESVAQRFCSSVDGTWSNTTTTCFRKSLETYSWTAAYRECANAAPQGLKGRLAVITSEAVYKLIRLPSTTNIPTTRTTATAPVAATNESEPNRTEDRTELQDRNRTETELQALYQKFCAAVDGAWSKTTDSCFKRSSHYDTDSLFNWDDAHAACANAAPQAMKGRLAVIPTETVHNLVAQYLKNSYVNYGPSQPTMFWLGLKPRNQSKITEHRCDYQLKNIFQQKDEWAFFEGDQIVANFTWAPLSIFIQTYPGNGNLCMSMSKSSTYCGHGHYSTQLCRFKKIGALCEFLPDVTNENDTCSSILGSWSPTTSSCFKAFSQQKLSWNDAQAKCVNEAPAETMGRLAVISTETVYSMIKHKVIGNVFYDVYEYFWFGLKGRSKTLSYYGTGNGFPYQKEWAFYEGDKAVVNLSFVPEKVSVQGSATPECMVIQTEPWQYRSRGCQTTAYAICEFYEDVSSTSNIPTTAIISTTATATERFSSTSTELTDSSALSEAAPVSTVASTTTTTSTTTISEDCWGPWLRWSNCTRPCGIGRRTRKREKPVYDLCYGDSFETGFCNNGPCKVCHWNDWSHWGICSAACGDGTRNRFHTKWSEGLNDSAVNCHGPKMEASNCSGSYQEPFPDIKTKDAWAKLGITPDVTEDGNAVSASLQDTLPYTIAYFSEEIQLLLGHNFSHTVPLSFYNGKACSKWYAKKVFFFLSLALMMDNAMEDEKPITVLYVRIFSDWKMFYDGKQGNCFTFNFMDPPRYHSYKAGAREGLLLVLHTSQMEYICSSQTAGFRLQIHNSTERPFPDNSGVSIPAGVAANIGIRRIIIQRLPRPYGDCVSEQLQPFYYRGNYTVEACLRSCLQKTLVKKCGCGDPNIPLPLDDSDHCGIKKKKCMDFYREVSMHNLTHDCYHCKQPCSETIFSQVVTISELKRNDLLRDVCREFTNDNETLYNDCLMKFKKNYAVVQIYYETLKSMFFVESPAYTIINLCSDFAGIMGIVLGASVISLFEFVYAIVDLILFFLSGGQGSIIHTKVD